MLINVVSGFAQSLQTQTGGVQFILMAKGIDEPCAIVSCRIAVTGFVRLNWFETDRVLIFRPLMTNRCPFRFSKTTPEIFRHAVTVYVRFPL